MKTILIAILIVIVAVVGWRWHAARDGEMSDDTNAAADYDVNSSHTPAVSADGVTASSSVQVR